MPFQYVQKTSPEANTDNRKIRENWCACPMCTISCAPNLNPCALCTGSIRAQCARCARVKACTDSSEKKVEVCQCIGSFLLIQLPVKARSFSCFPVDLLKNWILLYDMNKKEVQSLIWNFETVEASEETIFDWDKPFFQTFVTVELKVLLIFFIRGIRVHYTTLNFVNL